MNKHEFIEFLKSLELKDIPNVPKNSFAYEELIDLGIVEAFVGLTEEERNYAASVISLYPAIYYNQLARKVFNKDISKKIRSYFGTITLINWEYHKYFFHQYVGPFFYIDGKFKCLKMDVTDGEFGERFINHPTSHFDFFNSFNIDDSIDYGRYPRGRVIFNNFTNEFYIYVDKSLYDKKELMEEIKKIYNLTGYNNIVKKDSHYTHSGFEWEDSMSELDTFVKLIKESVEDKGNFKIEPVGRRFYFENRYFKKLEPLYRERVEGDVKINEFKDTRGHRGVKRICSVSSSARLCFSWLYKKGARFEIALPNPVRGNPAQLDAQIGNEYYECKCQEIINGEHEKLRESYKPLLEAEFGIKNIRIDSKGYLSFSLKDMGAKYDEEYSATHFNTKQLFTHLLAIAKKHPEEKDNVTLKYIIFKPSKEKLKGNEEIVDIYKTLDKEMKAIRDSEAIKAFLNRHKNISLCMDDVDVNVDNPEMMSGVEE